MTNPGIPPTVPTGLPDRDRLVLGDAAANAVAGWVQRRLAEQPWYRRKANTITTLGGALGTVVAFVLTSATGLPDWVTYTLSGVLLVLTVMGVNVTPNGTTPKTGVDLQEAVKDPAVLNAVIAEVVDTVGNVRSLDDFRRQATDTLQDVTEAAADAWDSHIGRHRRGD